MAKHLEQLKPRVIHREHLVGKQVLDCIVGLPPEGSVISTNAVQLNTGLVSGPSMLEEYGTLLNYHGHPTAIVSPRHPSLKSHIDIMRVSEEIISGEFDFGGDVEIAQLSFATHSLGTRNTIVGLSEYPDQELLDYINNLIMVAPVGFGGVQFAGGALETFAYELMHRPKSRHVRSLALAAFWYMVRANKELWPLIDECRSCDLREGTRHLMDRDVGVGAVLARDDHLVHHDEAKEGLLLAGVKHIVSIPGDHNGVLFHAVETVRAGMEVRDRLDLERLIREQGESA